MINFFAFGVVFARAFAHVGNMFFGMTNVMRSFFCLFLIILFKTEKLVSTDELPANKDDKSNKGLTIEQELELINGKENGKANSKSRTRRKTDTDAMKLNGEKKTENKSPADKKPTVNPFELLRPSNVSRN